MPSDDDILIDSLRYYLAHAISTGNTMCNGRVKGYMQTALDVVSSGIPDDRKLAIIAERLDDMQMEFDKCRKSLKEQKERLDNVR